MRWVRVIQSRLALTVMALLSCALAAQAQGQAEKWEKVDFAKQVVQPAEIQRLPLDSLRLLRGIIFGRHGRIFKEQDIQDYLNSRDWYQPNDQFRNAMLNQTERKNLDIIRLAEAAKHKQVEPGDLRLYKDRAFSDAQLGKHTLAELRVMRAEIEAIHGARFDDEPWLQTYFEERYWYQPAARYNPDTLSETERKNVATITEAEKKQRNLKLLPGDMVLFQNQRVGAELLRGLGLYELRLLRNEVYALHGRMFNTSWIQQYFDQQPWYTPKEDFKDAQLTAIEVANINTIIAAENRMHEEVSSRPVTREMLEGLFLEDARKLRNEIFARHGRTFKDKWLQKYFSSFAWYTPDPNFKDTSLTDIEKKNVATILAYEGQAESAMSRIEG
ncbi:MAG TPA: YARHG domain-containing protein [Blastocatellia bacterium]|nr:YARHG domain-containing protein [Blastocatellia bacterium]